LIIDLKRKIGVGECSSVWTLDTYNMLNRHTDKYHYIGVMYTLYR